MEEVSTSFIREHLMKEHEASTKDRDATLLLVGVLCAPIIGRYLAKGGHDLDAFVFFGSLSALVFFIRFFLMRSRKRAS